MVRLFASGGVFQNGSQREELVGIRVDNGGTLTRIRIDGEIVIYDLPPKPTERLRYDLSVKNPKFHANRRMGFHTEGMPETIESMVEMPDGSVHVPRGAISIVKDVFRKDGVKWHVDEDARTTGTEIWQDESEYPDHISLRDYQQEGVDKIQAHLQGLIVLPCGTGKTRLAVAAIHRINRTTLVTVPTKDLVDQWCESLTELLGIQAGRIGDGKMQWDRDVVLGIPNTLVEMLETEPRIGERFGFVIVDECHTAVLRNCQRMLRYLPARHRLLLTATPERGDGLEKLMHWSVGQTLLTRSTADMIKLGYLSKGSVDVVKTGWSFSWYGPKKKRITAMEAALAEDMGRNVLIADRVAKDAQAGETVLVLANRKSMVKDLTELLAARNVGVTVEGVTGDTGRKKRKGAIAELREGSLSVMVATSLADTGLDITRLSRIHLAWPQKARGATTQRLGRMLRLFPGKKPRLIDYVDADDSLGRRAAERMRVFKECGMVT